MYKVSQQTTRQLTATAFTKIMIVMPFYNTYGDNSSKKWPTEGINNEGRAIGDSPFGQYFTAERAHGVALDNIGNKCD